MTPVFIRDKLGARRQITPMVAKENINGMEPLDLSVGPPRAPRAELGGIIFLPRTIDKARAMLTGGNVGEYDLTGLSERMLMKLGIARSALLDAVTDAQTDEDILAFIKNNTTPGKIASWNEFIRSFIALDGDEDRIREVYPWFDAATGQSRLALDLLFSDDQHMFNLIEPRAH